jgi:chitodextrinase
MPIIRLLIVVLTLFGLGPLKAQTDPTPPASPVKLVMIHASIGRAWLCNGVNFGNLGGVLGQNNYYVSDLDRDWNATQNPTIFSNVSANGGTSPGNIYNWFFDTTVQSNGETRSRNIMGSVFTANNAFTQSPEMNYRRDYVSDPGGENEIVVFKPTHISSAIKNDNGTAWTALIGGSASSNAHTLPNLKAMFNEMVAYFRAHPDKMFVLVTPPPFGPAETESPDFSNTTYAANARAFNTWLVHEWLQNLDYADRNVYVFDFFNVVTGPNNHHRVREVAAGSYVVEHLVAAGSSNFGYSGYYAQQNNPHPAGGGSEGSAGVKATTEMIPLLNVYYHRFKAWRANGDNQAPTIPGGLAATVASSSQIDLHWEAATDNTSVGGYRVYRNGVAIATTPQTTYSSTGLAAETTYSFTVAAYDLAGNESAQSSAVSATTAAAPAGETITMPVADAQTLWSYFPGSSSPGAAWNTVGYNDASWAQGRAGFGYGDDDDTTVLNDMFGAYSTVFIRRTFTANFASVSALRLSVDYDDGFVAYLNGVEIARSNVTGTPAFNTEASGGREAGVFVDFDITNQAGNLASGTNVLAIVGVNAGTGSSDFSLNVRCSITGLAIAVDNQAPSVPSNLTATAVSSARVDLSWNAATDDTAVTGYRIYRNGTAIGTTAQTSFSDGGLLALTQYTYTVSAYDAAANESAPSASRAVTTLAVDTTAPSVPVITRAGAVSSSSIDLFWNGSTDDVAVAGYRVFRDGVEIATTPDIGYSDNGLAASTTYSYAVTAYDASGNESNRSAIATVATPSEIYTNYAAWRTANFSGADLTDEAISGPPADPDGVGLTNFARYAFALAARGPIASPVTLGTVDTAAGRVLTLTFDRRATASDLSYVLESSTDLDTWTPVPGQTYAPGTPSAVTAQDTVALGSGSDVRRFLRIRVVAP